MGLGALVVAGAGGANYVMAQSSQKPADSANMSKVDVMAVDPKNDNIIGDVNAPITLVEYSSMTCSHCANFHQLTVPDLKKKYIDTGKVRYIIREFPIGRSAGTAAIITRCAPAKDYFILYDKFLTQQSKWVSQNVRPDAIYKIAAQTGMTRQAFDACLSNKEVEEGLRTVKERGRAFGVSGTPTFFINGKKARGALTYDQIKEMLGTQVT